MVRNGPNYRQIVCRCSPVQGQFSLPAPHRLTRNHDPVPLRQLLRGQRWAKIRVIIAQKPRDLLARVLRQAAVRCTIAPAVDQPRIALPLLRAHQPFELPHTIPKTLGRLPLAQCLLDRPLDQVRPVPFLRTHHKQPFVHAATSLGQIQKGTF